MTTSLALRNPNAEIHIPDGAPLSTALARTRVMGIGAHPDDLEIMAYPGILQCYRDNPPSFLGVTCTDGAGSPRQGPYQSVTDGEMQRIRWNEQNQAASVGRYSAMIQLKYPSGVTKNPDDAGMVDDLDHILRVAHPQTLYTHNLADKHDTHVAVALRTIAAIRRLPTGLRPKKLYGIEVWRSLDWLPDHLKTLFPLDQDPHMVATLLGIFDSQIGGGKRYDLAVPARWRANATYQESHATDEHEFVTIGLDMTALITEPEQSITEFMNGILDTFQSDIRNRLQKLGKG